MKRILYLLLCCLIVSLSACGISQDEYDALIAENKNLQEQIETLIAKDEDLQRKIDILTAENENLQQKIKAQTTKHEDLEKHLTELENTFSDFTETSTTETLEDSDITTPNNNVAIATDEAENETSSEESPSEATVSAETTSDNNSTTVIPTETPSAPAENKAEETLVWIDNTAKRYHKKNGCGMDNAYQVTLDEAVAKGKTPCGRCYR